MQATIIKAAAITVFTILITTGVVIIHLTDEYCTADYCIEL